MSEYLTPEDLFAIQHLPKDATYVIQGVSSGIFSVARYSMGCTYKGHSYTYNPITDELIRLDVLKFVESGRRAAVKQAKDAKKAAQGALL